MKNIKTIPPQMTGDLENSSGLPHVYLLVGQGGVFPEPTLVQTVLGSCVAVTMYCAKYRWGAIFHALLPRIGEYRGNKAPGDHFRYVDSSIWYLMRQFAKAGIAPKHLECKVFGGGSPLRQNGSASAGERNAQTALEILAQEGVRVMATSLGGHEGRKLFFRTDTGLVLQKRFQVQASVINSI